MLRLICQADYQKLSLLEEDYLQRHEHKFADISEKLEGVVEKSDIRDAINRLMLSGYILKSGDVYRVNVEKLLDLK